MRVAIERLLVRTGHQVTTVVDGQQAVRVTTDKIPDLVLLDMMLPKLSGLEVLDALKQNSCTKHILSHLIAFMAQCFLAELARFPVHHGNGLLLCM